METVNTSQTETAAPEKKSFLTEKQRKYAIIAVCAIGGFLMFVCTGDKKPQGEQEKTLSQTMAAPAIHVCECVTHNSLAS